MENNGPAGNDSVLDYLDPSTVSLVNNGVLIVSDKSHYALRKAQSALAKDNEIRILFRGSGVDFTYMRWEQTDRMHWSVDGVASGNTMIWVNPPKMLAQRVVEPGTLNSNDLHILRLWTEDLYNDSVCGGCSAYYKLVPFDTVVVWDEQPINYSENDDPQWRYSGNWTQVADAAAHGGSYAASTTVGDYVEIEFNGSSIAVLGAGDETDTGTYAWSLDGGAQTGTVDQSLDGTDEKTVRWPELVLNGLGAGPHTLRLTVAGPGSLLGTGVQIDAVAITGTILPAELSAFQVE